MAEVAKKLEKERDGEFATRSRRGACARCLRRAREAPQAHDLTRRCSRRWNALMISGFCKSYQVFGDESHLQSAWCAGGGVRPAEAPAGKTASCCARWAEWRRRHDGVLADYAYLDRGLCSTLYETTFDARWLRDALELNEARSSCSTTRRRRLLVHRRRMRRSCSRAANPGDGQRAPVRQRHDGVQPATGSANSMATQGVAREGGEDDALLRRFASARPRSGTRQS